MTSLVVRLTRAANNVVQKACAGDAAMALSAAGRQSVAVNTGVLTQVCLVCCVSDVGRGGRAGREELLGADGSRVHSSSYIAGYTTTRDNADV